MLLHPKLGTNITGILGSIKMNYEQGSRRDLITTERKILQKWYDHKDIERQCFCRQTSPTVNLRQQEVL